jgi:hypothetical protein
MSSPYTSFDIPWVKVIFVSLAIVALIIVCVVIYRHSVTLARTQPMLIANPIMMSPLNVTAAKTKAQMSSVGREYTYNFWINVNDWGKGYGNVKNVLTRSAHNPFTVPKILSNPSIFFYPEDNNLAIRVSTMKNNVQYDPTLYPEYDAVQSPNGNGVYTVVNPYYYNQSNTQTTASTSTHLDTTIVCDVANIPLQRWVMVTVILWNRTLDVYINGMLVRSAILPGVPLFNANDLSQIFVGSNSSQNTFNGYISRLKYYQRAITAKDVMGLYKTGPLPANFWWSNLKQNIKVTLDVSNDS